MRMDLFMLIFLSLPEYLLDLPLMLIISGEKEKLKLKIGNVIRFFLAIALMLTATWLIRPLVSNVSLSVAVHSVAYTVIILLVYGIHPVKAMLGVAWAMLYLYTLENTFIPFVITYISKGITAFYGSNITLLVCTIPLRAFQFLAVRYFYKNNEFLEAVRSEKKYSIVFAVSSFIMTVAQMYIAYIYATFFDKYPFMTQLLFSCALLALMISFYVAIFGFIYIVVKKFANDVKDRDVKQKQQSAINLKKITDKNHNTLEELCHILENEKNMDKAIGLLKMHLHRPELEGVKKG